MRAIRTIKEEVGIEVCCSLSFVNIEQARRLRTAGLDCVNHNLNTSARHYPSICTPHMHDDRVQNLDICSGGIVGQGESDDHIVDMLTVLQRIGPKSVPINFLNPVGGTPFAQMKHLLTPCVGSKSWLWLACFIRKLRSGLQANASINLRSLQPMRASWSIRFV